MTRQKLLKISLFCHKRDDISYEEFHRYWEVEHAKNVRKCKPFMQKVYRYNQYHMTPEMKQEAESFGLKSLDFDGCAEFWVDSIDTWKALIDDPDGLMTLLPDEAKFVQHPLEIMYGYEELVVGNPIEFDLKHAPVA